MKAGSGYSIRSRSLLWVNVFLPILGEKEGITKSSIIIQIQQNTALPFLPLLQTLLPSPRAALYSFNSSDSRKFDREGQD